MKEKAINLKDWEVLATLNGRKTQARFPVKGKWLSLVEEVLRVNGEWVFSTMDYELTTPFGEIGDRLWVREAWNRTNPGGSEGIPYYRADGKMPWGARYLGVELWRSSIHIPRQYSRILLEITSVRVERVRAISEQDAIAEGAPLAKEVGGHPSDWRYSHREGFNDLWRGIHGPGAWERNDWVWAIGFKRVEQEAR